MSFKEALGALKDGILALIMPIIIIGGILSGVFTPTEAAGVSAVYALILGIFVYKELTVKKVLNVALESAKLSAMILLILVMASVLSWVLTAEQVPAKFANLILSLSDNKWVVLLFLNIIMLIMGMVLGPTSNLIILTPIFMEVAVRTGIDLIHLGIIMVLNLTIGLITPPVGTCLYTACGIAKIPLERLILHGLLAPLFTVIAVLLIVTYVPWFHQILPRLIGL
jgi:tripartite ATP-independent transporter DctM subunit